MHVITIIIQDVPVLFNAHQILFIASRVQYKLPWTVTKEKHIQVGSQTYIQLENEALTTTATASKAPMFTRPSMFTFTQRSLHTCLEIPPQICRRPVYHQHKFFPGWTLRVPWKLPSCQSCPLVARWAATAHNTTDYDYRPLCQTREYPQAKLCNCKYTSKVPPIHFQTSRW